jgi:hypothetical protein
LSLRLLLDEDTQSKLLIRLLREAGHGLTTVSEVAMEGRPDSEVLEYARANTLILLTRNAGDFFILHEQYPDHSGILAIYQDKDPAKNMSYQSIVKAVGNVETAGLQTEGQFIALNHWKY